MDTPTAEEAKRLTEEAIAENKEVDIGVELGLVFVAINKAIKAGKFYVEVDPAMFHHRANHEQLNAMGYKMEYLKAGDVIMAIAIRWK